MRDPERPIAEQHQDRRDRPRVLLVDDDPILRDPVALFIKARGADIVATSSAFHALKFLQVRKVAVLVSDIRMPERDGFWLIREIRARPALRAIPAIAFTSLGSEHRQRILDAGFSEHVVKDNLHGLWLTIQALRRRAAG